REEIEPLHDVAGNLHVRHTRHILQHPPERLRFRDDPDILTEHCISVAGRSDPTCAAVILTRRTSDHSLESVPDLENIKPPNVTAKQCVRSPNNTVTGQAKPVAKQT